jgi:hypothetical protein
LKLKQIKTKSAKKLRLLKWSIPIPLSLGSETNFQNSKEKDKIGYEKEDKKEIKICNQHWHSNNTRWQYHNPNPCNTSLSLKSL